ncbi:glycosyltransferase family 4 protein [Opitutaceae bacterium]|nr:glycosyltransferase family 4 protein [Opitutaceae bacterium]
MRKENYIPLRFNWRSIPWRMRRQVSGELARLTGAVTVWHGGWGLPWFADSDHSSRRIVCLWDGPQDFGSWLPQMRPWLDGVISMSQSATDAARKMLPDWSPERFQMLKVPMEPPEGLSVDRIQRDEWVIGCAGRLVTPQKRCERLVPFVEELKRLGVNYRIEVNGDGPMKSWLQQKLGEDSRIVFWGWQDRESYWEMMQRWDAYVSFTDHEGGPIVLLEAMAAGALPVFPAIGGSLGDDYLPALEIGCQYPAGDPVGAARVMRDLSKTPIAVANRVRQAARESATSHTPTQYDDDFSSFTRAIAEIPRLSRNPTGKRSLQWFDGLPLGLITRAFPSALWR